MAKRFIDTNLFNDEWFCELSKDGKMFFIYYFTNCDHAGILRLNKKLCKFQTDIENIDTVIKELGNTLITIKENHFFMPKFIKFQYPNFPNSNVKQQSSAISILMANNLWNNELNSYVTVMEQLDNSCLTVKQELTNSYDNDNDNDNVNKKGIEKKEIEKTWRNDFQIYLSDCKKAYKELINNTEFMERLQKLNPKINILSSLEMGFIAYWGSEEGWKNKKAKKSKTIDWKSTIIKTIKLNAVYY